jgi:branched-chain amino acid transport system ATP-binding protein
MSSCETPGLEQCTWVPPMMLEVQELHSGYGRIPILTGVSFATSPGETIGVLGHNGMGKTTLLKTIAGELPAKSGSIRLDGLDVTRLSMAQRARLGLGYMPQGHGIFGNLTVRENLLMGCRGHSGDAITEIVDHFPILRPLLDQSGHTLSGGERQILALARCLVGRPRLLLLDEPSEGVQPSIVRDIVARFFEVRAMRHLTTVLVEQNLQVLARLADRVFVMYRGRIASEISPTRLGDAKVMADLLGF